jgi:hypothetical protein
MLKKINPKCQTGDVSNLFLRFQEPLVPHFKISLIGMNFECDEVYVRVDVMKL